MRSNFLKAEYDHKLKAKHLAKERSNKFDQKKRKMYEGQFIQVSVQLIKVLLAYSLNLNK